MSSVPPPVPPLPPGIRVQLSNPDTAYSSSPHLEPPLPAPRPQKLTPDLPAEMARNLDSQISSGLSLPPPPPADQYRGLSPSLPSRQLMSSSPAPSLPLPAGASWASFTPAPQSSSPPSIQTNLPPAPPSYAAQQSPIHQTGQSQYSPQHPLPYPGSTPSQDPLAPAMAAMSFSDTPQRKGSDSNGPPSLTAPLPTIASLIAGLPSVQAPGNSPPSKMAWCRDVIGLVDRLYVAPNQTDTSDPPSGPIHIADEELNNLVEIAIPIILQFANPNPVPQPIPLHVAEGIYLRAIFQSTGAYPQFVPQNPRSAFRDFERAARSGFSAAWFKLGRDYENFGDFQHAKDCYERGIRTNNESCLYRLGMARLMGQLGLSPRPETALPLLQRAATVATVDVPQPAYVFALLLLGEFSHTSVPPHQFTSLIPPGSTRETEARRHLERAAYLNYSPAQYKLGHAYEFAQPPFSFDALLSVQYYSLASQQGEIEADMALSKWFLCGSEGAFDKDESLAFTFAEKAARKGLSSAEFAMGYYMEVGVGGPKDVDSALKWYTRASEHGNTDATDRLAALSQPAPLALSRQEHDNLTETTLVRKRTQAKQRSEARGPAAGPRQGGRQSSQQVVANIRKNSIAYHPGPDSGYPPPGPVPARSDNLLEGYPAQRPPLQQVPLSTSPGSTGSGFRPPIQPGPGPGGYTPPSRQLPLPASQPPFVPPSYQGTGSPGQSGYPSPRVSAHQPFGQPQRPPSQPQVGGFGQPGQQGRRPQRGSASGSFSGSGLPPPQPALGPGPGPLDPGFSDPPPARPPPGKGPATFQEMGYQSERLEQKECVIM